MDESGSLLQSFNHSRVEGMVEVEMARLWIYFINRGKRFGNVLDVRSEQVGPSNWKNEFPTF